MSELKQAELNGRNEAFWETQHLWNTDIVDSLSLLNIRVTAIEKRIAAVVAVAALVGSLIGAVLLKVFA